jgi:pyrroloquinoline quinone biosynthesis protein B
MCRFAISICVCVLLGCGPSPDRSAPGAAAARAAAGPEVVVLGSAQDGGVPHAACSCTRCAQALRDPEFVRHAASLAVVTGDGKPWLIDASPDLPRQLARIAAPRDGKVDRTPLAGVFLTHAHIGHYLGLAHLGFEVAHARGVPVFATPAMCTFLEANGPWDQLVRFDNIDLRPTPPGTAVELPGGVRVTAIPVPHRDEYADTVAYRIEGPGATVLYVPDTDAWDAWNPSLESRLEGVDVALLDATFHSLDELPGRKIEDVKHPLMTTTMDRLQARVDGGLRVVFTHLNHTNPAVDPDSAAARSVRARGFEIARDGDRIPLTGTVSR